MVIFETAFQNGTNSPIIPPPSQPLPSSAGARTNSTTQHESPPRYSSRNRFRRRSQPSSACGTGVMAEFLHNSTIHGFKELGRTEKSALRKFWIVVIISCIVGVSYEIYQIINYYSGKPGATQISWNVRDQYDYPPIAFCPKRWLRMERAERLGLTGDLLAYAVSLIQFDVTVSADFDEDQARNRLREIMREHNMSTYLDLIIGMGYEADGLLRIMSTPSEIRLKPFVPSFGLCYLMELKPILANTLRTSMLLRFAYKPSHRTNRTQLYDRRLQPHMLVRDSSGVKPNFITFSQTAIYQIDFEAQVYRRISRPKKPCLTELPDKDYHVGMCELMCIQAEKARRGCDACYNIGLMATLNMSMGPDSKPCANYDRLKSRSRLRRRHSSTDAKNRSITTTTMRTHANSNHIRALTPAAIVPPTNSRRTHRVVRRSFVNDSSSTVDRKLVDSRCSEKSLAEGTSTCTAKCLPPCEQWVYKHTTNLLSDESGDEIVIWVAYNPIDGILWYEEVPTYTVDTFISNIGGQLGLWLGASVISVVQIVYYFCLSAWRRRPTLAINATNKNKPNKSEGSPAIGEALGTHREHSPLV